jgi:hypothetical protein
VQTTADYESLAEEWRHLCSWFRNQGNQAIAATSEDVTKRAIQMQVTQFCRDVPPTKALLSAWQILFNDAVATWESRRSQDTLRRRISGAHYLNGAAQNRS